MSLPIRIDEAASLELEEAVRWYEAQRRGLGAELFDAVIDALIFLQDRPQGGNRVSADARTRRVLIHRFPYQLVYRIRPAK